MTYWLNLFTGTTWHEFRSAGGVVTGFRARMRKNCARIQPGDILLCYVTGVMRWVGALRVVGPSQDNRKIWKDSDFPVRLDVKTILALDPEHGVPMENLQGKVVFFENISYRPGFRGFLRMSPNRFQRDTDGETILAALRQAEAEPIERPVDPKKLARKPRYFKVPLPKGHKTVPTVVSVPDQDETEATPDKPIVESGTRHTEIQHHLLCLGAEMGLGVWVARNDRHRVFNGNALGDLPGNVSELPTQFNDATNRTIELIDVLWLRDNSIVAAFEVEATTSVYSGLLRMSDLLALQPNLNLDLFLVAPDDRRAKVRQEISRPTFAYRQKPLRAICGFISFERLVEKVEGIHELGLATSLKPAFLKKMAEYFADPSQDDDDG